MNTSSEREKLAEKFKSKEYRDAFVADQIFSRLPFKIRTIREDQGLTQTQLGELAGMAQAWVSKLEDPSYGKLTISTLLKLASAFDVGIQIDFVAFSRVLDEALQLSLDSFSVPRFQEDQGFVFGVCAAGESNAVAAGATGTLNLLKFPSQFATQTVEGMTAMPRNTANVSRTLGSNLTIAMQEQIA